MAGKWWPAADIRRLREQRRAVRVSCEVAITAAGSATSRVGCLSAQSLCLDVEACFDRAGIPAACSTTDS